MNLELAKLCVRCCEYGSARQSGEASRPESVGAIGETLILKPDDQPTAATLVLEFAEQRIVVFPGTISEFTRPIADHALFERSLLDWVQDFRAALIRDFRYYLPGRVHEGFVSQLYLLSPELGLALTKHHNASGDKPLILTGHSQGAAIAQIATVALPRIGFEVAECYSFAPPKPGDGEFAAAVPRDKVHRFEYGFDIVPHSPITMTLHLPFHHDLAFDYQPCGQLSYSKGPGSKTLLDMDAETEKVIQELRHEQLKSGWKEFIDHHHLTHYAAMLEEV